MTQQTIEINLPSRLASVSEVAQQTATLLAQTQLGDAAAFGIDMAVREAVANAILHGNKQDAAKQVEVVLRAADDFFEMTVRDFGTGFALGAVPDPTEAENLLKTSGRGILFMRTFMDEVEWSRHAEGGTVVRLLKKR